MDLNLKKTSSLVTGIFVTAMLISGTTNTLANKIQNETCAHTRDGRYIKFKHPWVQTLVMFAGEFLCLGMYFVHKRWFPESESEENAGASGGEKCMTSPSSTTGEESPLINNTSTTTEKKKQPVFSFIFALPAALDLFGSTIASVALLFLPSSVWQLMRGSLIVFVGIFSVIFLKRRLRVYNWVGMGVVMAGLICVGASVLAAPDSDSSSTTHNNPTSNSSESTSDSSEESSNSHSSGEMVFGVILILVGQMISAVQFIVEEMFVSKRDIHPLQVVGMEGFFGLIFTSLVLIPWYYVPENPITPECVNPNAPTNATHTHYTSQKPTFNTVVHDDSLNAFYQMKNPVILVSSLLFLFSIACYNFTGLTLTKRLSAVHRTLIDACRSLSVWVMDLFIYYVITNKYGEKWSTLSFAELGGFVLLVIGTLMYNAIIRFPCFDYEDDLNVNGEEFSKFISEDGDNRSPMIAGSPKFISKEKKKDRKKRRNKF